MRPKLGNEALVTVPTVRGFNFKLFTANPAANAPDIIETTLPKYPQLLKGEIVLVHTLQQANLLSGTVRRHSHRLYYQSERSPWRKGVHAAHVYQLIQRQPHGEPAGPLHTASRLGNKMVLADDPTWAVTVYWYNHEAARKDADYEAPDHGRDTWVLYLTPSSSGEKTCTAGSQILFPYQS
ncbi:MAG TPA: hypothetical protein VJL39_01115 [Candidatus Paceibacterota bacterium]